MAIKKIGIVGLGALGTMYADYLLKTLRQDSVVILADQVRVKRYQQEGVFCNGTKCEFQYESFTEGTGILDLLIFAVKIYDLPEVVKAAASRVGKDTIILSVLNGITSEDVIDSILKEGHILHCTVQGMDAEKSGNQASYSSMGYIAFGELDNHPSKEIKRLVHFFDQSGLAYQIPDDMIHQMWGKLLLNVGVNQAAAVFATNYGGLQKVGEARTVMIAAMKEVLEIARYEGVIITEDELESWLLLLDRLNSQAKPSLCQDLEAGRKTEVELFSGTILKLGQKYQVPTPYNQFLYGKILELEQQPTCKSNSLNS